MTSSIYQDKDGKWHGRVTMGVRDDGRADRRHVRGKNEAEVTRKVRNLEKARDSGHVTRNSQAWTLAQWLQHWLDHIAAPAVRENTLSGYRVAVTKHLVPGIGAHRLARLQPEHLEKLYAKMIANGSAAATAHQAHRTVRTALNEAVRRGYLATNPARIAKAPRLPQSEIEPYTVDEVKQLIAEAENRRNSVRWVIALALGLRQGEALGLRWPDVDLGKGALTVRRALQRPRWKHGCGGTCGRTMGGHCPERVSTRATTAETKSWAGRRVIGLPDELVPLLKDHKKRQGEERELAANLWQGGDWVFTTPTGGPLNPRTDYTEWKRLLKRAGIRDGRLHDARHTAATVLLLLGVPVRAVVGIMGWSDGSMAMRYQHLTAEIHKDIAKRVGGLLWAPTEEDQDEGDDGSAGTLVPA
ncbi:tyrosine-type recombinase/integrase [Allorhizocola rhizosphaerae]|uniref:tyrosine-type recombinase/integrase n=1 Tax=Allorhizocola rhizosphaerae TaxID=1872709 RepID=UPI001FE44FDD|nr:site-specific integrase [Allorhizocola rhizosphaerae]